MNNRYVPVYWIAFFVMFIAEFALGYWIGVVHGYVQEDAMSRVANAFYVSYSRDPHLAAIGFVWNPLPSLVEWVWLQFWPLFPQLATASLAGTLTTSLFAAATFVVLLRHCLKSGFSLPYSFAFCLIYALNPFLFLYGANGMSEMIFAFFMVVAVTGLTSWLQDGTSGHIVIVSLSLGLSLLTRYEAIPLSAAVAFGILIGIFFIVPKPGAETGNRLRQHYLRAEGNLVVLLSPLLYTGLIWMFLNYMIMGDPLYFLRSSYSNLSFSEQLIDKQQFTRMIGNPTEVLAYMMDKSAYFSIPLGIVLLIRLLTLRLFRWDMLIFLAVLLSIPALQFVMLLKGSSYGWLRFFFYILPVTAAWIPYEIKKSKMNPKFGLTLHMIGLLAGGILIGYAMNDPVKATEEYDIFHKRELYAEQQTAKEIAGYINDRLSGSLVLMDSSTDFQIILNAERPDRLVITSDTDFEEALRDPNRYGVRYLLLPSPKEAGHVNAINREYPRLYEEGADWVTLEKQFGTYRKLYRINP